ncbi:hypothetical protein ACX0G9_16595 [Flavitalea flava]
MKKLIFLSLFIPCLAKAQFTITNTSTINLVELRTGIWPVTLQRIVKESDTIYMLEFRDLQYTKEVNMTTIKFGDLRQLKYFQKGLSALKNGSTGDAAKFKEFTIKRMDVKKEGVWYLLTSGEGESTNFLQPEADKLISAIKGL